MGIRNTILSQASFGRFQVSDESNDSIGRVGGKKLEEGILFRLIRYIRHGPWSFNILQGLERLR
jgi:hypothetical protein